MTQKDLRDAVERLGAFLCFLEKQIDTGFNGAERIDPGDPRLAVLYGMCMSPAGALQQLLTLLGAAPPARPAAAPTPVDAPPQSPSPPDSNVAGSLSFDDFLTNVGSAMLSAQKKLDNASAQYLKDTGNQPNVLPSVFRLPKLSASMKFAFDDVKSDKLNLVFYTSGSQESNQHQQQVQFDIVSAPAPLEAVTQARNAAPSLNLLLGLSERKQVLAAAQTASAALTNSISQLASPFTPDRALLLTGEPGKSYFLLYAGEQADGDFGIWLVTSTDPPGIEAIHRFDPRFASGEAVFQQYVHSLGVAQEAYLSSIRG
jgi:hypothetical protein